MLQKAVLATIAYYDALEYPVTEFEVWKHLLTPEGEGALAPVSLLAVIQSLNELAATGRIIATDGFYTLAERQKLIVERLRLEKEAVTKLKRASRLMRWCGWVPFVRMLAITGSLSMKRGDKGSDWDFFVVLSDGAIWTGRLLLTAWLELLGQRRHGKEVRDRACLNCYVTDRHMEIPLRDLYSSHEYRFMYPVIGLSTFRSFEIANRWIHRYRPHFSLTEIGPLFARPFSSQLLRLQRFLERLFPLAWLEPRLAQFQKKKIERNPKTQIVGSFIEASDQALIFLPEPKGPQIFERFKERLSHL